MLCLYLQVIRLQTFMWSTAAPPCEPAFIRTPHLVPRSSSPVRSLTLIALLSGFGHTSKERLCLFLSSLPNILCWSLPHRELSHNKIEDLPSFHRCQRLEEL